MGNTISLSTECERSLLPIADRGLTLQVIQDILKELKEDEENCKSIALEKIGRNPSPGEIVVHGLIKEKVRDESLAENLHRNLRTRKLVGTCNVFLSHTWGTPFEDTVEALEQYEGQLPKDSTTRYYFVDFFSINQFKAKKDLELLGKIVMDCETLVLYAKPWHKPAAVGRAWCIFELAHAVKGETEIVLAMPLAERLAFKESFQERLLNPDQIPNFLNIFTRIESSKMRARFKEDLEMIKGFVMASFGGFDKVDQIVSSGLKQWLGNTAVNFCKSFTSRSTYEKGDFLISASNLFVAIGWYERALKAGQKAIKIFDDLKSERDVLLAMMNVGGTLYDLGRHVESLEWHQKTLRLSIEKYGEGHDLTLRIRFNVANSFRMLKKWDQAEEEFTSVLKFYRNQDPMSYDNRLTKHYLAVVLRDSGKDIGRAEKIFKTALDYNTEMYGSGDSPTLIQLINYGRCLAMRGDHDKALKYYEKALPVLVKTYGEKSNDVQDLAVWISELEQHADEKKQ